MDARDGRAAHALASAGPPGTLASASIVLGRSALRALEPPDHLGEVLVAAAGEADEVEVAPPFASVQAIACEDSSAGMIPSSRASRWNAASASASVTAS